MPSVTVAGGDRNGAGGAVVDSKVECGSAIATCSVGGGESGGRGRYGVGGAMPGVVVASILIVAVVCAVVECEMKCNCAVAAEGVER